MLLDRQAVERDVRRLEEERPLEIALPRPARGFLRQGEDQVDREVLDSRVAQFIDGALGALRIVDAMHPLERSVIERLHAK